jgi:hypothetical protein
VCSLRGRIDDQEIKMKYIETLKMVSDLGTKNLGVRQFEFLRDLMSGCALVRVQFAPLLARRICLQWLSLLTKLT